MVQSGDPLTQPMIIVDQVDNRFSSDDYDFIFYFKFSPVSDQICFSKLFVQDFLKQPKLFGSIT